jgi:predicted ATPase
VLFGPNGAGKSNLLDALHLLSRTATSRTLKEAFESPCRGKPLEAFSFGPDGTRSLLTQQSAHFSMEVDVELSEQLMESVNHKIVEFRKPAQEGLSNGDKHQKKRALVRERLLRYRIEVEISPKSGILRVVDESLVALNKDQKPRGDRRPFFSREVNLIHLRMEGQAHPRQLDLGLDHTVLSMPHYPPHYPHLTAMREELASWAFFYFEPRERMRAPNPVKEVRSIGLMGEDLAAYLNTLKVQEPKQFQAIGKALGALIPSISDIDLDVNDIGEVELKLREDKTPIPARLVSEGTLRILGLLALQYVQPAPALMGFEEPENGVHPRRIRAIADALNSQADRGNTQILATTHSPNFIDMMSPDNLYQCKKVEGSTLIKPFVGSALAGKEDLFYAGMVDQALDEEATPISQRLLRGDFDD